MLYSVFSDIGTLNFLLNFIYLIVCNFMGSGITSEYTACDDNEWERMSKEVIVA